MNQLGLLILLMEQPTLSMGKSRLFGLLGEGNFFLFLYMSITLMHCNMFGCRFPFVCISIGLTIGKVPTVGVVYNPIMDEVRFCGSHVSSGGQILFRTLND